jgi:hypothetical protein
VRHAAPQGQPAVAEDAAADLRRQQADLARVPRDVVDELQRLQNIAEARDLFRCNIPWRQLPFAMDGNCLMQAAYIAKQMAEQGTTVRMVCGALWRVELVGATGVREALRGMA